MGDGTSSSKSRTRRQERSFIRTIEEALEEHAATADLRRLVRRKCERDVLISYLINIRFIDPRLNDLHFWTGRDRRQVKADRRHILKTAKLIESLLKQRSIAVVVGPLGTERITKTLNLPTDLRRFAALLQELLNEVSGRKHLSQEMAHAALVRYVFVRTGKWHDPEVAAVISAVLAAVRHKDYSTEVHKRWRRENYRRLAEALSWFEPDVDKQR